MKDSRYFKHDSNARNDPKIKALIKKYGIVGYGKFWIIIELMREASHYRLEDEPYIWDSIAEETKSSTEEAKEFVEDCTETFKLFVRDEGYFYSSSLLARMIQLEEIRVKRSEAAKARWDNE